MGYHALRHWWRRFGCLGLYHLDASGITLSWMFGLGLVLIGVAYLVALFGIKRFEAKVKDIINE